MFAAQAPGQQTGHPPYTPFVPNTSITGETQKAMALVTAPISIFCGETLLGSATGFFFSTEDNHRLFLITNRHVVVLDHPQPGQAGPQFPDHLVLRLHTSDNDFRLSANYIVPLYRAVAPTSVGQPPGRERLWREVDADTDVVAIELSVTELNRFSKAMFTSADLLSADMSLPLGEALVVIGYPLGFSDQMFNLPIAREGTVASVFPVPFQGKRFFLVDARLHPGTSGSPVVTRPTQFLVQGGAATLLGHYVTFLVGINSGSFGELNLNAVWFADVILELTR